MPVDLSAWKRTHRCGELRKTNTGNEVTLAGWAHKRRDHGGVIFVDLRDRTGLTQVVFEPDVPGAHKIADSIRSEFVLAITGTVRPRPEGMINPKLPTGEIEVRVTKVQIFNPSKALPFQIEDDTDANEELRLKYRYLDLRRSVMQQNFERRSRATIAARTHLASLGFLEIETPFMTKYTPGGARNFLVPSRANAGSFYALAESPQIFKQLLMVSGFDRYFQVVRCFRDEDLRADRQPEFTQIDLEMSFADEEDIAFVVEGLLASIWKAAINVDIPIPFPRISYDEAMSKYGTDRPDLRFGLPMANVSDVVKPADFGVFQSALSAGGIVVALAIPKGGDLSRKDSDEFTDIVKPYGGKGVAWTKVADGDWTGGISKFLTPDVRAGLQKETGAKPGDLIAFVADKKSVALASMGALRTHLGRKLNLIDPKARAFCWVRDFPLFETSETGPPVAAHHPFTSPRAQDVDKLLSDPAAVKARAYDVVLNGVELGGGSVRIHEADVQAKVFEALGITGEDATNKFGFLLDAFTYGAPPHAGIAFGMDRIAMLLAEAPSLRDVVAFPKTQKGTDLMTGAPTGVAEAQLDELSVRVNLKKK